MADGPAATDSARRKPAAVQVVGFDERGRPMGRLLPPLDADVRPVILDAGSPGDVVDADLLRKRRGVWEARRVSTLQLGPAHVQAPCAHFGVCGGCRWQETAYAAQLAAKAAGIEAILRGAGLAPQKLHSIPAPASERYRNRMEFSFGATRWVSGDEPDGVDRTFALGMHPAGRFDRVLDINACLLAFPETDALLAATRAAARAHQASAHDSLPHRGLLRMLLLRKGVNTGEILLELVSDGSDDARAERVARSVAQECPWVSTMTHVVHQGMNDAVGADARRTVLLGTGVISEVVAGVRFRIQPRSFFQTNTAQAEILARLVVTAAQEVNAQHVQDWCCGAGFFALVLAKAGVPRVLGIEISAGAVEDARVNALANALPAEFVAGDIAVVSTSCATAVDMLVVDPPRAGLPPAALEAACNSAARRLVYVACDLRASIGQIRTLVARGWQLTRVTLLDQFPHTPHTEVVLVLDRAPRD